MNSTTELEVAAFSVALQFPTEYSFVGVELADTHVSDILGPSGSPWHTIVTPGNDWVHVVVFLSGDLQTTLPAGNGQVLFHLQLELSPEEMAPLGGPSFAPSPLGTSELVLPGRVVRPVTRNEIPSASPGIAVVFPAPTVQELSGGGIDGPEAAMPEGGGMAFAGGGSPCEFDSEFVEPDPNLIDAFVDPTGDHPLCDQYQSRCYTTIQAAIQSGWSQSPLGTGQYLIKVLLPPGQATVSFQENLCIDAGLYPEGLLLYSEQGTETVFVDGSQGGSCSSPGSTLGIQSSLSNPDSLIQIGAMIAGERHGLTLVSGLAELVFIQGQPQVDESGIGGGVFVGNVPNPVQLIGNDIGHSFDPAHCPPFGDCSNRAEVSGGGVGIIDERVSVDVTLFENRIQGGVSGSGQEDLIAAGGGLFARLTGDSILRVIQNEIFENTFSIWIANADTNFRTGGGLFVTCAGTSSAYICSNEIHENEAIEGAGIYLAPEPPAGLVPPILHLEGNDIRDNTPWVSTFGAPLYNFVSYRGGGASVSSQYLAMQSNSYDIRIWNNRIHGNTMSVPFFAGAAPAEVGGGLSTQVAFNDPNSTASISIVGNAIYENTAGEGGGGAYLGLVNANQDSRLAEFHNNTVTRNSLVSLIGSGSGLYLPDTIGGVPGLGGGSAILASSNVVLGNPTPVLRDWYCEALDPLAGPFVYSQLPDLGPLVSPTSIFDPVTDNSLDPQLETTALEVPRIARETSVAIDTGDPAEPVTAFVSTDLDADLRSIDIQMTGTVSLDRGMDEFLVSFVRGDATGDGNLSLLDYTAITDYLFSGVPLQNCADAYDANDDGLIDLADAVYILSYLLSPCPCVPPPPPWPDCGLDPTVDALDPCVEPSANPCL